MSPSHVVTSHDVRAYHGTLRHCLEGVAMLSHEAGGRVVIFRGVLRSTRFGDDSTERFRVDEKYPV
jgi:hypothetical protein